MSHTLTKSGYLSPNLTFLGFNSVTKNLPQEGEGNGAGAAD
jgi:hypothetical protein